MKDQLDRWGQPATPGASCSHCGFACQVVERPQFGDSPLRLRSACCTAWVKFKAAS